MLSRIIVESFQNMYKAFPGSQWLGLYILTAKGPGSILGWRIMIPQDERHSQEKKKYIYIYTHTHMIISSVQLLSNLSKDVQLFVTPWTAACQASLHIINSQSLLKLLSIKSVMPSNQLILCHPLLLLPSIFPSIRVFSKESVICIRWPKNWSFRFSISSSNEYSGLISFRAD